MGTIVTGAVTNIVHFGCFVDIGIGRDCLIHSSEMRAQAVEIGSRVEAKVLKVEIGKGRVNLSLMNLL